MVLYTNSRPESKPQFGLTLGRLTDISNHQPKISNIFPSFQPPERKKMSITLSFNPIIRLKMQVIPPQFPAKKTTTKSFSISARLQNQQQQQLNLSVLRFTLGISLCILLSMIIDWCMYMVYDLSCAVYVGLLGFRDTWVGRVLLAQMDWLRVWFASDSEPFRGFWFCYYHSSSACDSATTLSLRLPFVRILCGFSWFSHFDFALSVENRSSGPFFGSILHFYSLSWTIS